MLVRVREKTSHLEDGQWFPCPCCFLLYHVHCPKTETRTEEGERERERERERELVSGRERINERKES